MKKNFLLFGFLMLVFGAVQAQHKGNHRGHRVVMQLSSSDTLAWKGVVKNIIHLREAFQDQVQIEVVAHSAGIDFLVNAKSTQREKITELAGKGVVFAACQNTMKDKNITKEALIPAITTVPSGVAEIVKKEEQGWSYLKSGF